MIENNGNSNETKTNSNYDFVGLCSRFFLKPVMKDNKWGFINEFGKEVVPLIYDWVSEFELGYAKVKIDGEVGIIDEDGKKIVPNSYTDIVISEDYFIAKDGLKKGVLYSNGQIMIPLSEDIVNIYKDKLYFVVQKRVRGSEKWGAYDIHGHEVIPPICDCIRIYGEKICTTINGIDGRYYVKNKERLENL